MLSARTVPTASPWCPPLLPGAHGADATPPSRQTAFAHAATLLSHRLTDLPDAVTATTCGHHRDCSGWLAFGWKYWGASARSPLISADSNEHWHRISCYLGEIKTWHRVDMGIEPRCPSLSWSLGRGMNMSAAHLIFYQQALWKIVHCICICHWELNTLTWWSVEEWCVSEHLLFFWFCFFSMCKCIEK